MTNCMVGCSVPDCPALEKTGVVISMFTFLHQPSARVNVGNRTSIIDEQTSADLANRQCHPFTPMALVCHQSVTMGKQLLASQLRMSSIDAAYEGSRLQHA